MTKDEEYRRRALEAQAMADLAKTDDGRAAWLQIAQSWLRTLPSAEAIFQSAEAIFQNEADKRGTGQDTSTKSQ